LSLIDTSGGKDFVRIFHAGFHEPNDWLGVSNDSHYISCRVRYDVAEELALKYIRERLAGVTCIRHVAQFGETPGWDIQYTDSDGELVAVEVKGASGAAFSNFELTEGELAAARKLRSRYWIYLVAGCLGLRPRLHRVQNPHALLEQSALTIEPLVWRIWHT
jgi:hypothetical protein